MKITRYLLVLCCVVTVEGWCQEIVFPAKPIIEENMISLNRALIEKDTLQLNVLLHKNLTLGHSNGWIESKPDLLNTLVNEGVIYKHIENIGAIEIYHISKNLITTRRKIDVKGMVNNTEFEVKLNVLEVWIRESGNWQLLARQSVNRKE